MYSALIAGNSEVSVTISTIKINHSLLDKVYLESTIMMQIEFNFYTSFKIVKLWVAGQLVMVTVNYYKTNVHSKEHSEH